MSNTTSATVTTRTRLKFTNGKGGAQISKHFHYIPTWDNEEDDLETKQVFLTVVSSGFFFNEGLLYDVTLRLAKNQKSWVVTHNHGLIEDEIKFTVNGETAEIETDRNIWGFNAALDTPNEFVNKIENELVNQNKKGFFQNLNYIDILDEIFDKLTEIKNATNERIRKQNADAKKAYKANKRS